MWYVITGVIAFFIGSVAGVVCMCLANAAGNADTEHKVNYCDGCLGAANNDCSHCPHAETGEINEER